MKLSRNVSAVGLDARTLSYTQQLEFYLVPQVPSWPHKATSVMIRPAASETIRRGSSARSVFFAIFFAGLMAVSEVADAMIPDPSATNEVLASFSLLDFSD